MAAEAAQAAQEEFASPQSKSRGLAGDLGALFNGAPRRSRYSAERARRAPSSRKPPARAALQAGIDAMLAARAASAAALASQPPPTASQRKARSDAAAAEAASIDADAALICEHASTKVLAARGEARDALASPALCFA